MKRRHAVYAYIAMAVLAVAVIIFAFVIRIFSGIAIYDCNFEAFHRVLTDQQGDAIIRTAQDQLMLMIFLLLVTNVLWLLGAGLALFLTRSRTTPRI